MHADTETKQASRLAVSVTPVPGTAAKENGSAAKALMPSSSQKMLDLKTPSPCGTTRSMPTTTTASTLKLAPIVATTPEQSSSKTVLALLPLGQGPQLKVVTTEQPPTRYYPNSRGDEPFPLLAIRMINEVSETHPELMNWSPDGKAFFINEHKRVKEKVKSILLGYCKRKSIMDERKKCALLFIQTKFGSHLPFYSQ